MKRLYYVLIAAAICVLSIHCQREVSDFPGGGDNNNNKSPINATVQGNVVDQNGQPAAGVAIKVGNKIATTDNKGYFRIVKANLDKKTSLVTAEKPGYFTAYRVFSATSGANYVTIQLIQKTLIGTIAATGGEVTLPNGAKVALPANAVVKKGTTTAYTGTINVYAAYIDPTAATIANQVPGSFLAENTNDERVVLTSYGMMAVELESTSGEKLQIASGVKATLTVPVPSSLQGSAPATIPLWYVDEQTGLWQQEGQATKSGNNYVGEVSHFSFWNCDISANAVILTVTLKDVEGGALVHAQVRLTIASSGWQSYGWTDSVGQVSGYVPNGQAMLLEVLDQCGNAIYSQNVGPITSNTNLGNITVTSSSQSIVHIKGKLVNCTGANVTNGYAIITIGNVSRYAAVNINGDFDLTVTRCSSSPNTCDIVAVDNATQQQGTATNVAITVPATNAGILTACGVSAVQFINYTVDGNNYTLSTTVPGDSVMAYYGQGSFSIYGRNLSGSKIINLGANVSNVSTPAAGTYPLSWVSLQNINSASAMIPPSNITFTNFPAVAGDFYEGNLSGSFKDSTNLTITHTMSATFRIRKN